jgi:hypothetical protein
MNVWSYSFETEAPWEKWEVDNEFLQALQKWNASKPESSLDEVMKKVQEKLSKVADLAESEMAKAAMEHIPNSPFPAGTLVKGLVSVMVIGVVGSLLSPTFVYLKPNTEDTWSKKEGIWLCDGRGWRRE